MLKPSLITLALLSSAAFADVNLELPQNSVLLVVNGDKAESGVFKSNENSITLEDGQNQIVYKIETVLNAGSSQSKKFESKPLVLTFDSSNSDIVLSTPPIRSDIDAKKFNRDHKVELTEKSGALNFYKNDVLPLPEGFSFSTDYVSAVEAYNESLLIPVQPLPSNETNALLEVEQTKNMPEEQLKYWFEQADEETKKSFVSWAVQNM